MTLLPEEQNPFACYPKDKNYGTWFEIFFNKDNYKEKFKDLGEDTLDIISKFITSSSESSLIIDDIIFMRITKIDANLIIPSPAAVNNLDH